MRRPKDDEEPGPWRHQIKTAGGHGQTSVNPHHDVVCETVNSTNIEPDDLTIFWISSTFKKVEEQVFGALVDIQITGIYTEQESVASGHRFQTLNLTVGSQKLLFFMRTL